MANKVIKGITIEIGGDTTKLGKALADTEKKSRDLQAELKEINGLLKFDPTNTELLTQKQNVLADTILETTNKLNTLKDAEKQIREQLEKGEIGEDQYRAFQREIQKTEQELEKLKGTLQDATRNLDEFGDDNGVAKEQTQKLEKAVEDQNDALEEEKRALAEAEKAQDEHTKAVEDAKKEVEDYKNKLTEVAGTIGKGALAVGAGAGAVAGYAVKMTTDFDKAFNSLQAQTGATTEEMGVLEESMKNLYAGNYGESIEDVAQAMATVATQTDLSGQALEDATRNAIVMRDTFDFDVNESIRGVNSMMNQFGITADEAYNLIAQGAQNGLNQNGDLLDTVNEYSVQFAQAGYSAEDMFNMLKNGAETGTWSIDKLGDAVKEYNIRMTDGTANEALETLGLNVDEVTKKYAQGGESAQEATTTIITALKGVEDEQDRYTLGQEIMGTMWEDLGEDAVYALLDTQGEISKTSDALETINDIKYDDLGSAIGGLKRTLETDIIKPLGDELKPLIEEAIQFVKDNAPEIREVVGGIVKAVGEFIKFVVDNGDVILSVLVGIGTALLAWNVVTMIQGVVGAIKAFKLANEGATIAQWALNVAMNANPIGLIIALIAGLVAGFIALWNTSEDFRNFFINLWENIKNAIGTAVKAIGDFFSGLWKGITELFGTLASWFNEYVIQPIVNFFSGLWETIKNIFSVVADFFKNMFGQAVENIKHVFSVIGGFFSGIWDNIKQIFSVVSDWFKNMFQSAVDGIKNVWSIVTGFFSGIWDNIKRIFSVVGDWFKNMFQSAVNGIKNAFSVIGGFFSGIWTNITKIFSGVGNFFKNAFNNAVEGVKNLFNGLVNFFGGVWDKITGIFKKVGTTIADAITGSVKKAINTVLSGAIGIINGFISAINLAIGAINLIPGVNISKIKKLSAPQLYKGGILEKGQVGLLEGNGAEAVVPLEKETGWINRIAQKMNELQDINPNTSSVAVMNKMDEMIQTVKKLKSSIVLDTGVLVGETVNQIDEKLGQTYSLRERRI